MQFSSWSYRYSFTRSESSKRYIATTSSATGIANYGGGSQYVTSQSSVIANYGSSVANYSSSYSSSGRVWNSTKTSSSMSFTSNGPRSSYTTYIGWVNFSITNIHPSGAISTIATLNIWQTSNVAHSESIYNPTVTPAAADASYWGSLASNYLRTFSSVAQTTTYQTLSIDASRLKSMRTNAASTSISTYMLAFNPGTSPAHKLNIAGANAATSKKPYLAVQYAAPWSVAITPSANPNKTSVCANDGVFTLTAAQTVDTRYVSISPTSWSWYSATASAGPYLPMGGTNASTYAVTAPSNTGSVWYKFNQSVNFYSNSTLETKANTYSITYCKPGSIYISQCCTSLGSNPTFSATQVSDRSVTLTWSGMNNVDLFVIRYGVDGGVSFNEITVAGNETSKLIERLTNGRSYYFQIQAIGASGYCDTQLSTKTYLTPECNE